MNTNPKIFAFNTVYEQNYKGAFRFVKSYVHSDATAEDIVSESLIKLWKNIKGQPVTNIKLYFLL